MSVWRLDQSIVESPTKMSEAAGAQNHLQKPSKIEPQIEVVRVNSAELYG